MPRYGLFCIVEVAFVVDGTLQLSTRCFSSTLNVGLTLTLGIFSTCTLFFSCLSIEFLIESTSLQFYLCKFSMKFWQVFVKSAVAMILFWYVRPQLLRLTQLCIQPGLFYFILFVKKFAQLGLNGIDFMRFLGLSSSVASWSSSKLSSVITLSPLRNNFYFILPLLT